MKKFNAEEDEIWQKCMKLEAHMVHYLLTFPKANHETRNMLCSITWEVNTAW